MYKIYAILLVVMLACLGCEWRLRHDLRNNETDMFVERYDKREAFFLTTGDFSAMQEMLTQYPLQTRRLIEDVLQLGKVEDANIKTRFYNYFQDSTLQMLIAEVNDQYGEMDELDSQLEYAFVRLHELVPEAEVPSVYTQISSLDQSICVGDGVLGISLDKYLGADYPLYVKYGYTDRQRSMMVRDFIVPDCLGFYLLSLFPFKADSIGSQRDEHMGRIQLVVNEVLDRQFFDNEHVTKARQLMNEGRFTYPQLLKGV
jgi:hypothetical protein